MGLRPLVRHRRARLSRWVCLAGGPFCFAPARYIHVSRHCTALTLTLKSWCVWLCRSFCVFLAKKKFSPIPFAIFTRGAPRVRLVFHFSEHNQLATVADRQPHLRAPMVHDFLQTETRCVRQCRTLANEKSHVVHSVVVHSLVFSEEALRSSAPHEDMWGGGKETRARLSAGRSFLKERGAARTPPF